MTAGASSTVLITGCSSGIGRAAARAFLDAGHLVYATARRVEDVKDLAAAGARILALDVLDEESMQAAVRRVADETGPVGVLVNNAGYALQSPVEEAPMSEVRRQFETNVFGLVRLTQLVLPGMRAAGHGRIVNLSSMGGRFTFPGGGFYHATKHAVESLSDALRLEVAAFGVRVVVIEPGPVLTAFGTTALTTLAGDPGAPGWAHANDEGRPGSWNGGPYADFRARLAGTYAGVYSGDTWLPASSPQRVAAVIVKAATARRPRARYVVGPVARALVTSRRVLPDRAFDALVRSSFPTP